MKDLAEITFKMTVSGNEKVGSKLLEIGERVLNVYLAEFEASEELAPIVDNYVEEPKK